MSLSPPPPYVPLRRHLRRRSSLDLALDWRVAPRWYSRMVVLTHLYEDKTCMVIAPKGRDTKCRLENVSLSPPPPYGPLRRHLRRRSSLDLALLIGVLPLGGTVVLLFLHTCTKIKLVW